MKIVAALGSIVLATTSGSVIGGSGPLPHLDLKKDEYLIASTATNTGDTIFQIGTLPNRWRERLCFTKPRRLVRAKSGSIEEFEFGKNEVVVFPGVPSEAECRKPSQRSYLVASENELSATASALSFLRQVTTDKVRTVCPGAVTHGKQVTSLRLYSIESKQGRVNAQFRAELSDGAIDIQFSFLLPNGSTHDLPTSQISCEPLTE